MARYSKREFAALCGIETKDLSVYILRKKVTVVDEQIDDTDPKNTLFVEKMKSKKPRAKSEKPESGENLAIGEKKSLKAPSKPNEAHQKSMENLELDNKRKNAVIEKLEAESRQLRFKEDKMLGKLIPTDVVKSLFATHFKSITMSFKQASENMLMEVGKKAKLNRNDLAQYRGEMTQSINRAVENAILETKKNISNIVSEYSQNRAISNGT